MAPPPTQPGDKLHILHVINPCKRPIGVVGDGLDGVIGDDAEARCEVVSVHAMPWTRVAAPPWLWSPPWPLLPVAAPPLQQLLVLLVLLVKRRSGGATACPDSRTTCAVCLCRAFFPAGAACAAVPARAL